MDQGSGIGQAGEEEGRQDGATWLHKARSMPKDQFKREVEKELTGRETKGDYLFQAVQEPNTRHRTGDGDGGSDARKRQIPRLLSGDDLCGFPGRRKLDNGNPDVLSHSVSRFFKFLPGEQRHICRADN